jgi:hypothetical protein
MSLIFVAPRATEVPSPSHYFSFYSRLYSIGKFEGKDIVIVSSVKLENSEAHKNYEYLLTSHYTRDNFSGPKSIVSYKADCQRLLDIYDSKSEIHFYDGNFREFLLLLRLCLEESSYFGSFNFQNGSEWQLLLKSKKLSALMIRKCMRVALNHVSNIKFYAESDNLSSLLNGTLAIESDTFPLATNLPRKIVSKNIKYEILFLPQSHKEVNECVEIARNLKKNLKFRSLKVAIRLTSNDDVELRNGAEHVVFIRGYLNTDKYMEMLASANVVIFPYFNNFYEWGSSGKYLDTIYLKTVTIVPENSRMHMEGLKYGYTFSFRDFSFGEISNLIEKALSYTPSGNEEEVKDFEKMLKNVTLRRTLKTKSEIKNLDFRLIALFWALSFIYVFYISENQSKKAIILSFFYNRARQIYHFARRFIKTFNWTVSNR